MIVLAQDILFDLHDARLAQPRDMRAADTSAEVQIALCIDTVVVITPVTVMVMVVPMIVSWSWE